MLYLRIYDPDKQSHRDEKKPVDYLDFSKYLTQVHYNNYINTNFIYKALF